MDLLRLIYGFIIFVVLSTITYYDLRERRIPNSLLVIMLLIKGGYLFLSFFLKKTIFAKELFNSIFGFSFFVVIGLVMYIFLCNITGAGDFKLLIVLGFVLGFFDAIAVVMICLVISFFILLKNFLLRNKCENKLPMAPIILSAVISLCLFKIIFFELIAY